MTLLFCRRCRAGFEYHQAAWAIERHAGDLVFAWRCPNCRGLIRGEGFAYPADAPQMQGSLAAGPMVSDDRATEEARVDEYERFEWEAFVARQRSELFPMIEGSAVGMILAPSAEPDVKLCLELGALILFDKPIVVVISPGQSVPAKLARIADATIEADVDTEEGKRHAAAEIQRVVAELAS